MTISRAQGTVSFPAKMMLIGAMNPCPCDFFGDSQRACTCSPQTVTRYQRKLSGPLIDRIDIHLEVPRVDYEKLSRTIADLANSDLIGPAHVAETVQYRPRERV